MLASTSTMDLDIQRQMVDEHCTLGETTAGKSLQVELNRERRRHQQERKEWNTLLEKSLRKKDNMQAALAKQFMEERDKQIKRTEEDMIRLKQTFETHQQEAFREKEARREAERAETQATITLEREAAERQRREHDQALASEKREHRICSSETKPPRNWKLRLFESERQENRMSTRGEKLPLSWKMLNGNSVSKYYLQLPGGHIRSPRGFGHTVSGLPRWEGICRCHIYQ